MKERKSAYERFRLRGGAGEAVRRLFGPEPRGRGVSGGGTLFLDEIGDMSPALQSKLLRVLENQEVRRVGGVRNIPVDVRIICATNMDLKLLVNQRKFREDLYYRLSVFTIELPALKNRCEDIIPIAEMFLDGLNEKYGGKK